MSAVCVVGISGPSSSGKTTISRLLRDILLAAGHSTFILHEDDFYVTDKDIPIHQQTGYQDWDCLESIDVKLFSQAVQHIQKHGTFPPDLISKEDRNSVGKVKLDDGLLDQLTNEAKKLHCSESTTIAIIDGFLLFTPPLKSVYSLINVRLFLPVTRQLMLSRRSARSGYVTLEGFWEDPPDYVEKVVWPNYAKDHAYLFENGDVEGQLNQRELDSLDLRVAPHGAMQNLTVCLQWAADVVFQSIIDKQ